MGYTHSRAAVRAILALAAATATATAVAEDSADLLAEVIVTAQKREESMQKVPIAVTALDAAALEKSYIQAPFEDCTKEQYETMLVHLNAIDLSNVIELDDNTDLSGELACAGGACEIK